MSKPHLHQVLVVYKHAPRPSVRYSAAAAREHVHTLERIHQLLQDRGIAFRTIPIEQLGPVGKVDLVITVGGDGTVLATSHFVKSQPILGVKSFGHKSVGFFCAATRGTVARFLDAIAKRGMKPRSLSRLQVRMGGHRLEELVLNECLFAHGSPAALTEYRLTIGKTTEFQRSSGVWVSTAAGSTAAIAGAGGAPMALDSDELQYRVREPYTQRHRYRFIDGVLPENAAIKITSLTPHGTLSIDGAHIQYPAPEGTQITIKRAKENLRIYWR